MVEAVFKGFSEGPQTDFLFKLIAQGLSRELQDSQTWVSKRINEIMAKEIAAFPHDDDQYMLAS